MSHVNESCPYGWVMSHMNESWSTWRSLVTYGWVISLMDELFYYMCRERSCSLWTRKCCYYYQWIMSDMNVTWSCPVWMWHDSVIDTWYESLMCNTTHWCVTWLINMWHDGLICHRSVTWRIDWYLTWHVNTWHESFICDMTDWHDMPLICDTTHWWICDMNYWLICDMTRSLTWLVHWYVTWLIH